MQALGRDSIDFSKSCESTLILPEKGALEEIESGDILDCIKNSDQADSKGEALKMEILKSKNGKEVLVADRNEMMRDVKIFRE